MVLKEVEFEDVDCIQQTQCRVKWRAIVIVVMNQLGFVKGEEGRDWQNLISAVHILTSVIKDR